MAKVLAVVLAAACLFPAVAAPRKMNPPKSNWNLYIPGKANKKDVVKDLEKQGWLSGNTVTEHFSLIDSDVNKGKLLKFDTNDSHQEAIAFPLSGNEKRVTLIFKARGATDPDNITTPLSIFLCILAERK